MRGERAHGHAVIMNVPTGTIGPWRTGERRPVTLTVARVVLWCQGTLFAIVWAGPHADLLASLLRSGVEEEDRPLLLLLALFSAPLAVFAVVFLVLARRFGRGGRGVWAGAVLAETLLPAIGAAFTHRLLHVDNVDAAVTVGLALLPAVIPPVVLLGPRGRAHFGVGRARSGA